MKKIIAVLGFLFATNAQANLQVFPTRVLLTEKERVAQLSVRHSGATPMKYRISAAFFRMAEDGSMTRVEKTEPTDKYAGEYFRFSPREVELAPDVEQVVRIIMTKPAELPAGDYRAYLYFEGMDEVAPPKESEAKSNEARMQLKARMAIAIPVIVRSGEVKVEPKLADLNVTEMPDKTKGFKVELAQEGNGFVHGDFFSFFTPKDGPEMPIGRVNAVSSYLPKRTVSFGFNLVEHPELKNGMLRLELRAPQSEGGKTLATITKEITN